MLQHLRRAAATMLKTAGVFALVKNSRWRRKRLLILCYHGVSLDDEHLWRPYLYISPRQLDRRLQILRKGDYKVLPLSEALERLYRNDLPPRSVALTFDDGGYDFYKQAWPRLKEHNFPVTVYLTTYYSDLQRPVFSLMCSYLLWKARDQGTVDLGEFGIKEAATLGVAESRQQAAIQIVQWADAQDMNGEQKDQVAARLARCLHIDYAGLRAKRILQIMNRQEVKQLADAGVDFQLHTHRHRTSLNESLFRQEIRDNRAQISTTISGLKQHFCYPSGAYRPEFLEWLSAENILSAATCDPGFATAQSHPLLLPRLVDTTGRTDAEFESWVSGAGAFLTRGKLARPAYSPD
jgi:peptidoglycan/xylan/chitin deacetylase (PgdA/CDA1 family)